MEFNLATVTLARLYVQQGHLDRARAMLEQLVDRRPDDGAAWALARRLTVRRPIELTLELAEEETALVRWRGAPHDASALRARLGHDDARLHVVLAAFGAGAGHPLYVTSRRCARARGELLLPCGPAPGSVAACLVAAAPERPPRTLAVADAMTWLAPRPRA